jgi:metal-responsive CopG/Arc/MetJ family transcriptional regulator
MQVIGMPQNRTATPKLRGQRQQVPVTLPPELVRELNVRAEAAFISRAKLIELLIREALAARAPVHGKQRPRTAA